MTARGGWRLLHALRGDGEAALEAAGQRLAPVRHAGHASQQADIGEDFRHASLQQDEDGNAQPLHRIEELVDGLPRRRDDDEVRPQSHHGIHRKAEPAADQRLAHHLGGIARIGLDPDDAIGEAQSRDHFRIGCEDRHDPLGRRGQRHDPIEPVAHDGRLARGGDERRQSARRRYNRRPAGPHHHRPCRPTMNSRPGIELPHAPFWKVGFARQGVWSSAMKMGCWLMSKMLLTAANRVIPLETPTS